MRRDTIPSLVIPISDEPTVQVHGAWLTDMLAEPTIMRELNIQLTCLQLRPAFDWDLNGLTALDHIGAQLLWQTWGKRFPEKLKLQENHRGLFERLAELQKSPHQRRKSNATPFGRLGGLALNFALHLIAFTE